MAVDSSSIDVGVIKWLVGILVPIILTVFGWVVNEMRTLRRRVTKLEVEQVTEEQVKEIVHEAVSPIKDSNRRIEKVLVDINDNITTLRERTAALDERTGNNR